MGGGKVPGFIEDNVMRLIDTNKDGKKKKVPGSIVDNVMSLVDTNNDGKIDRHEFDQVLRACMYECMYIRMYMYIYMCVIYLYI